VAEISTPGFFEHAIKILRHPVLLGLAFEAVLVGTFTIFPVGPCVASAPGVAVLYLH
jgi:hypothetical protein